MHKRLKVKLYPTQKQAEMLENHFSAYRYCYNLCLEYKSTLWSDYRVSVSGFEMKKELYQIRKESEWLLKCKAECIGEASLNLDASYQNFFKHSKGFPKFKSKRGEQSFCAYQSISCQNNKVKFYKNKIKFKTSEQYNILLETHKIKQVTFKRDLCGDYWASFLIDTQETKILPKTDSRVGIDLGIKDLVITSEGETFENKKYLQNSYYKLRRLQRKHSKSKKESQNREKLRVKIARLHRKISNQKNYYYHQITNQLLNENQVIYIENLCTECLLEEKKMSRQISDASWGLLTSMLEYKAIWYGREVVKIDRWFPSSKTCSNCGTIKTDLKLSDRTYNCNSCGFSIDRDLGAAINILKEGQRIKDLTVKTGLKIPEVPVEKTTIVGSMKQEVNRYNFETKDSGEGIKVKEF